MDAFEKLEVWKRSSRLCVDLYRVLRVCPDRGFKDQICRAALSVPSNIAEGYERNSRKEYIQFLRFAKGSCGELRTQVYVGAKVGFLDGSTARKLVKETTALSNMLGGLIAKLKAVG